MLKHVHLRYAGCQTASLVQILREYGVVFFRIVKLERFNKMVGRAGLLDCCRSLRPAGRAKARSPALRWVSNRFAGSNPARALKLKFGLIYEDT